MRRILHLLAMGLLLGTAAFLYGCSDEGTTIDPAQDTGTSATEEDAIRYAVAEDDDLLGSTQFMGQEQAMDMRAGGPGKTAEAINTVRWWRTPLSIEKTVNVEITPAADSLPAVAEVTVSFDVEGILHLIAAPDDSTRIEYEKAFDDASIRYAVYAKRPGPRPNVENHRRGWVLTQISGASIASDNATRQILSITAEGESGSHTFTDPLELLDVATELPFFAPGEDVTITVVTGDATDRVFLHAHEHRFEFTNNGDGTYSGTWHVKRGNGAPLRAFGVDVLSAGTLGDDVAPYDSRAWILPYRVVRPTP